MRGWKVGIHPTQDVNITLSSLTRAVSAIHKHTHKHKYHHRQSRKQMSIQTKLCKNAFSQAFGNF